jgi:hypothetical protein
MIGSKRVWFFKPRCEAELLEDHLDRLLGRAQRFVSSEAVRVPLDRKARWRASREVCDGKAITMK